MSTQLRPLLFVIHFIVLFESCTENNNSELVFEKLLCEYSESPIGIDIPSPRFSWIIASRKRAKYQSAYQVVVANETSSFGNEELEIWNSGKVMSGKTTHINYGGSKLEGNATYFWKVVIWDEKGVRYQSEVNSFSTGLLSEIDWNAKWIGANNAFEPKPEKGFYMDKNEESPLGDSVYHRGRSILLRKSFEIDKEISSAKLYITGLGFYESEINGERVGDFVLAPAKTPYHKHILYDTYDIAEKLKVGKNAIGIHLGNGWYNPYKKWWKEYRMQWFGYKKALAQLHIKYFDGSEDVIVSDENWKRADGPLLFNCVYDGEIYDANEAIAEWSEPDFDDSNWEHVVLMDGPKAKLLSQTMPSVKINEIKKPVKITEPRQGMKVYDLGQNFTGWVRIKAKGEKGTKVRIRFSEELYDDGTLNITCNERAKATIEYIMKGDELEIYEPSFTYFGFQFVEITANDKMPEIVDLEGCVVYSSNERIGNFLCSHELINKVHHATLWSQMSNMLSYPMDCPQRDERLGWMGDAQVTAEEAMFNFNMALHYKNWFNGIRANQDAITGDIPIISPRPYIKDEGVEWSSTFLTMVWNSYTYYGDQQILGENYEAMKRYVNYLGTIADDFIIPNGWIGDWGSMVEGWQEGEPKSVSTAYFYYNAIIMGKIARILANESDVVKYSTLASNIRNSYNKMFFNPKTIDYNDGSQMANAFPLYLGIVEDQYKDRVIVNLVHDIEEENDTHLTTGVLGTKYLIDALSMCGRSDVSWALATQTTYPSWAEMMKHFNTMCEFWTLKQSHNHVMMGSIDAWFYKVLAGIQLDENYPAFEKFVIRPYPAQGLNFVQASTNTIKGQVASNWEKTDDGFKILVKVPFNCSATIFIPNSKQGEISEGGKRIDGVKEIQFIGNQNGYSIVNVQSGDYLFSY